MQNISLTAINLKTKSSTWGTAAYLYRRSSFFFSKQETASQEVVKQGKCHNYFSMLCKSLTD